MNTVKEFCGTLVPTTISYCMKYSTVAWNGEGFVSWYRREKSRPQGAGYEYESPCIRVKFIAKLEKTKGGIQTQSFDARFSLHTS